MGNELSIPNVTVEGTVDFVRMNDGKFSTTNLFTESLYGCYGLIASSKHGETKSGIITHYDTTRQVMNVDRVKKLCDEHHEFAQGDIKGKLFIPERLIESGNELLESICRAIGDNARIKPVMYPCDRYDNETEILLARLDPRLSRLLLKVQEKEYHFIPRINEGYNPDFQGFFT